MEDAMCYSKDWTASDARKREEAKKAQAAHEQRAGAVDSLLKGAEKHSEPTRPQEAVTRESVPAKQPEQR